MSTSVSVEFTLHLEHMDLAFAVANGKVTMAPGDFTQLLEVAKPKHAGLFGDTLKQMLELVGKQDDSEPAPATPSANRRMFDALTSVEEIRDSLNGTLVKVTGELARLTAMPPIFDDGEAAPAAAQPAAPAPAAPAPVAAAPASTAPTAPTPAPTSAEASVPKTQPPMEEKDDIRIINTRSGPVITGPASAPAAPAPVPADAAPAASTPAAPVSPYDAPPATPAGSTNS